MRIVLYSHDTLGFGHIRRNLLIAGALADMDPKPEILLLAGMHEAATFPLPKGVDCITLPAYAKQADGSYHPRDLGDDLSALTRLRAATIHGAATAFNPDLFIVDNVPRGAQYELDQTLKALKKNGHTRIVLGLRDIIDRAPIVRKQWIKHHNFATLRKYFDAVWIYGDPALYDIMSDCFSGVLGGVDAVHVGYLDPSARCHSSFALQNYQDITQNDPRPYVLCAAGGGRDGAAICTNFAQASFPAGHRGILITGTQMPQDAQDQIAHIAQKRTDLTVLPFVREPIKLMAHAKKIVGMAGYNTSCEILALGVPSLMIPRVRPREEQWIRATKFAEKGLVRVMHPDALSAQEIGQWLCADVDESSCHKPNMQGLEHIKHLAENYMQQKSFARHSLKRSAHS